MRQKIRRLRLEVVDAKVYRTTTSIAMPEELPSVEEQLKQLELEVVVLQIQQTTTSNELPSVEEALKLFAAISGLSGTVLGIFVGQKA